MLCLWLAFHFQAALLFNLLNEEKPLPSSVFMHLQHSTVSIPEFPIAAFPGNTNTFAPTEFKREQGPVVAASPSSCPAFACSYSSLQSPGCQSAQSSAAATPHTAAHPHSQPFSMVFLQGIFYGATPQTPQHHYYLAPLTLALAFQSPVTAMKEGELGIWRRTK